MSSVLKMHNTTMQSAAARARVTQALGACLLPRNAARSFLLPDQDCLCLSQSETLGRPFESRWAAAAAWPKSRRPELPSLGRPLSLGRPRRAAAAADLPRPAEIWDCANAEDGCELFAMLCCERTSNKTPKYLCLACYEWYDVAGSDQDELDLTKTTSLDLGEVEVPQL